MDRLNIIIANDFAFVNGGAGQAALVSARRLAERGHNVTVFAAVKPVDPELNHPNLSVVCMEQQQIAADSLRVRAMAQGIWNRKAGQALAAVLERLESTKTIVHVHGWTKALSSSVIRAAVLNGFEVVCTLNDYFVACPNGGFVNYPKQEVCRLRPLSLACIREDCDKRNYSHKLWRVVRQVVQDRCGLMPGGIRHFISVSKFSQSILAPYLPSDATLHLVRNPIDVPKEEPVNVRNNSSFVMVGRLVQEKGVELFARAARQLGVQATFVGEGECRAAIAKLNPAARIVGWCPRSEVLSYMRGARSIVFPSIWYEANPLVVLESAALGVPAIVSDVCASREDVLHGKTGLWCKAGDIDDLMKQITSFLDDQFVDAMGRSAFQRYWSNPETVDHHVDQLEKVYSQMLLG
jgi:glycosyltransferase involved in cell wall biosynthesis